MKEKHKMLFIAQGRGDGRAVPAYCLRENSESTLKMNQCRKGVWLVGGKIQLAVPFRSILILGPTVAI